MKKATSKKLVALVSAVFAIAAFGSAHARYTLLEVIDACEGAYDNGQQISQCITNVCGYYGCD